MLLKSKGLGAAELAQKLECAEQTVRNWITARNFPMKSGLGKLAGAMGIPVSILVEDRNLEPIFVIRSRNNLSWVECRIEGGMPVRTERIIMAPERAGIVLQFPELSRISVLSEADKGPAAASEKASESPVSASLFGEIPNQTPTNNKTCLVCDAESRCGKPNASEPAETPGRLWVKVKTPDAPIISALYRSCEEAWRRLPESEKNLLEAYLEENLVLEKRDEFENLLGWLTAMMARKGFDEFDLDWMKGADDATLSKRFQSDAVNVTRCLDHAVAGIPWIESFGWLLYADFAENGPVNAVDCGLLPKGWEGEFDDFASAVVEVLTAGVAPEAFYRFIRAAADGRRFVLEGSRSVTEAEAYPGIYKRYLAHFGNACTYCGAEGDTVHPLRILNFDPSAENPEEADRKRVKVVCGKCFRMVTAPEDMVRDEVLEGEVGNRRIMAMLVPSVMEALERLSREERRRLFVLLSRGMRSINGKKEQDSADEAKEEFSLMIAWMLAMYNRNVFKNLSTTLSDEDADETDSAALDREAAQVRFWMESGSSEHRWVLDYWNYAGRELPKAVSTETGLALPDWLRNAGNPAAAITHRLRSIKTKDLIEFLDAYGTASPGAGR